MPDEEARQFGFKWIPEQMYHNTDYMLETHCLYRNCKDSFADVRVTFDEDEHFLIEIESQFYVDANLEDTSTLLWGIGETHCDEFRKKYVSFNKANLSTAQSKVALTIVC